MQRDLVARARAQAGISKKPARKNQPRKRTRRYSLKVKTRGSVLESVNGAASASSPCCASCRWTTPASAGPITRGSRGAFNALSNSSEDCAPTSAVNVCIARLANRTNPTRDSSDAHSTKLASTATMTRKRHVGVWTSHWLNFRFESIRRNRTVKASRACGEVELDVLPPNRRPGADDTATSAATSDPVNPFARSSKSAGRCSRET